jgi:hypothetical protein
MNGIKLLVSAVVALIAVTIFASEHIIAWYEGRYRIGGHAAGRL